MATVKTTEDVVNWLSEFSLTINDERQGTFSPDHKAYDCTLSYGNKQINLTYQSNPQFNGEPTVTDIVQSMVSDAQSFDKYRSIDEFANAFGYVESDIPISQVISAYNGCKDTYEWLCGNDGKPLYDNDLPVLSDVLDEHESEIRAAVEEIHQKKAELESYNNPAIPEGFVSIQDVMQQFDLGSYGDQIIDHDESEDIASAFAEIADGNVDIYYNKLLSWLPENYEWIEKPENRWSSTLSTHDTDKETMTISSVSKDMSASSKEIKEHNTPVKEDYQLLSRLQADCEYYLGACAKNQVDMDAAQKHLWAGTIEGQIDKMKELYQSFPESKKPEWISPAAIDQYEKKMLSARDNTLQTHHKDTVCSLSDVAESSRKNSDSLAVDGRGTDEPFTR